MSSTQRVVIVTGASKGIGAAIATRLAHEGWAVVVNYSGDEAAASAVVEKIEAAGERAVAIRADVSDPASVATLFDETERQFGGIDALVNNAGVMTLAPIAESSDALFDQHIAVNLRGTFNNLREGARRIREGGRIVNFSSSVVGLYQPGYGVYAATKGAVEAMTHILAKELGPKKITVNAVAPGPVATKLFLDGKTDEQIAQITRLIPAGRLGEPDDIASVVALLLSPDGQWISGQVIRANGGIV